MKKRLTTEKEAKEKVGASEKEIGIKYTKRQKEVAIKKLTGRKPWFE